MPKCEKIYVIIINGVIGDEAYTSLRYASKAIGVPERTLWRWMADKGSYNKKGIVVWKCEVVRISGRGR